jgi:hypothetical protein
MYAFNKNYDLILKNKSFRLSIKLDIWTIKVFIFWRSTSGRGTRYARRHGYRNIWKVKARSHGGAGERKPGPKGALQKWKPRLQVKADRSQGSIAMSRKGHLTWMISNTNIKCDYATNRSLSSFLMTRNLVRWQTHQFHTLHCYRRNWARMFFLILFRLNNEF